MSIRLTKKRLAQLNAALSVDDVLHEKFRRLNAELQWEREKLHRAKRIVRVLQKSGKNLVALQIEAVQVSPDGTTVVCR